MQLTVQNNEIKVYDPSANKTYYTTGENVVTFTYKETIGHTGERIYLYVAGTPRKDFYIDYDKLTLYNGSATIPVIATILADISENTGITITDYPISLAGSTAAAASLIAKATPGTVYSIFGYNAKTTDQFVQLLDSATLPADTTVPDISFKVDALSNFALDLGEKGVAFASGIVACNSSTQPTKTIGGADCWFNVQYR